MGEQTLHFLHARRTINGEECHMVVPVPDGAVSYSFALSVLSERFREAFGKYPVVTLEQETVDLRPAHD